jgi:hypothetical protein
MDDPDNINDTLHRLKSMVQDSENIVKRCLDRIPVLEESISYLSMDRPRKGLSLCGDFVGYSCSTPESTEEPKFQKKVPIGRYTIMVGTAGAPLGPVYERRPWADDRSAVEIHDLKKVREIKSELKDRLKKIKEEVKAEKLKIIPWKKIIKKLRTETPDQWILNFKRD